MLFSQHPINMLDATSEILGDAEVVAPVVLAANLHSFADVPIHRQHRPSSYFSVFSYQTRDGDYSDRMGCIHGEELPYVLGAPLTLGETLGHFSDKYSQSEQQLSMAIIAFWTNFARTGSVILFYPSYIVVNFRFRFFVFGQPLIKKDPCYLI